jgi:tetratricopeptide (TPR) repeat protein
MINLCLIFLALLITSCATRGEKLRASFLNYPDILILDIPFYAQTQYHCGPAALAMTINHLGINTSTIELSEMIYTPGVLGTFQTDLTTATHRLGLIAAPVQNIQNVILELNDGNPILVFQNLGLKWIPKWHYAVVVGYDLTKNEIILHTGEFKNYRMKISTFENTWNRVDNWGLLIVKPGVIPRTTSEAEIVKATASLELIGELQLAQLSYENILKKWQYSLGALVGLGNVHYQKKEYLKAREYLEKAMATNPQSSSVKNNLDVVIKTMDNNPK